MACTCDVWHAETENIKNIATLCCGAFCITYFSFSSNFCVALSNCQVQKRVVKLQLSDNIVVIFCCRVNFVAEKCITVALIQLGNISW